MQVVTPMNENKFDTVCEAAVKLVEQLKKILDASGLDPDQAGNVLAMATGGVIKSLDIDPDQFMQSMHITHKMWRQEHGVNGIGGAVFDPPHKRSDFVPVERDSSREN
jgi:hypothetical protein